MPRSKLLSVLLPALAGALSLHETGMLGIAMGSSEAAGFMDRKGRILGWLNELAFAPIDYREDAPVDEWSHDLGCGVQKAPRDVTVEYVKATGEVATLIFTGVR